MCRSVRSLVRGRTVDAEGRLTSVLAPSRHQAPRPVSTVPTHARVARLEVAESVKLSHAAAMLTQNNYRQMYMYNLAVWIGYSNPNAI